MYVRIKVKGKKKIEMVKIKYVNTSKNYICKIKIKVNLTCVTPVRKTCNGRLPTKQFFSPTSAKINRTKKGFLLTNRNHKEKQMKIHEKGEGIPRNPSRKQVMKTCWRGNDKLREVTN